MSAYDCLTPEGRALFDRLFSAERWAAVFHQPEEFPVNQVVHDVMKSSNPDTPALLRIIAGLAAQVSALQAELAALPQAFVVPDENGKIVIANRVIAPGTAAEDLNIMPDSDEVGGFIPLDLPF